MKITPTLFSLLYISILCIYVCNAEVCDESGVCLQEEPVAEAPAETATPGSPKIAIIGAGIGGRYVIQHTCIACNLIH